MRRDDMLVWTCTDEMSNSSKNDCRAADRPPSANDADAVQPTGAAVTVASELADEIIAQPAAGMAIVPRWLSLSNL